MYTLMQLHRASAKNSMNVEKDWARNVMNVRNELVSPKLSENGRKGAAHYVIGCHYRDWGADKYTEGFDGVDAGSQEPQDPILSRIHDAQPFAETSVGAYPDCSSTLFIFVAFMNGI